MKKDLISFVDSRIGIPYIINGRSLETGMDCFGMLMDFYTNYLGWDLEDDSVDVPEGWQHDPAYEQYKQDMFNHHGTYMEKPELFCVVFISTERNHLIDHGAIYIGEDKMLNTGLKGIRVDRLSRFKEANMVRGFLRLER